MLARRCKFCGRGFMPGRDDHHFCRASCRAAYELQSGSWRERYHDDNDDEYWMNCEWCGAYFGHSGYSERGGQRRQRCCSDRCRGAWHRAQWQHKYGRQTRQKGQEGASGQKQGRSHDDPYEEFFRARFEEAFHEAFGGGGKQGGFDPYATLGIKQGASKADIKNAYRKLAKEHHPDVNHNPAAEERMKDINRAYDMLTKE